MIQQHNIVPWDPQGLLQRHVELQQEIAKTCPLRYIGVHDGSEYFGRKATGIIDINGVSIGREKFVEISLNLFKDKGLHVHPDEAKRFYDAFDSIDVDKNARLSPMELAAGLPAFFGGTVSQRCEATFNVLSNSCSGGNSVTEDQLYQFIEPFVCIMVPRNAAIVRPFLTSKVTQQIISEMTMGTGGSVN